MVALILFTAELWNQIDVPLLCFFSDLVYSGDYNPKGGCHSNVPVTMASEHYEKKLWAAQRQYHQFVFQTDQRWGTKKFANKCSSVDGTRS